MTDHLKKFLNDNIELIEQDKIYELVSEARRYAPYYPELLKMLLEVGALESFEDLLQQFIKNVAKASNQIDAKNKLDSFSTILISDFYYSTKETIASFKDICKHSSKMLLLRPDLTGAQPQSINLGVEQLRFSFYSDLCQVTLIRDNTESASLTCKFPVYEFFFMDILDPARSIEHLQAYMNLYDDFCKNVNSLIDSCRKSFTWMEKATKIAESFVEELKARCANLIEITPTTRRMFNNIRIDTGINNSKGPILVHIPFDSDPATFDVESAIKECMRRLKIVVRTREQAPLKAQAKAQEIAANRPANYKQITRKDISDCARELGIPLGGMAYTNKYSSTTTYKWIGPRIPEAKCKELYDKLRSIGADVISVESSMSGSGWRVYPALFVKIRN